MSYPLDFELVFGANNQNYVFKNQINVFFLQAQERYLEHLRESKGYVFLNDVLDALGFDRIKAGQFVGWSTSDSMGKVIPVSFNLDYEALEKNENGSEIKIKLSPQGEIVDIFD